MVLMVNPFILFIIKVGIKDMMKKLSIAVHLVVF
ncbi:unnamed protein product [Onchocerca flexuosa]|uniref:Uncharacterized protein n=1 Tax=Onchocerca flexuosa TaxID=387005 RepID=A0A183HMQ7_9BILA|nr:unnamed protein product [Onchocerca flexuosa]